MTYGPFDDCIEDASVDIEVTRYLAQTVDKGRVVDDPEEKVFCTRASVQPASPKDLQLLPEGMRNMATMVVYTTCELYTVRTSDSKIPDRFEYRGVSYQVHSVDDWYDLGGYYRCIAVRMDR